MRFLELVMKNNSHINYIYPMLVIYLLQRLHGQLSQFNNFDFALKISSDEESFISMGSFCDN